MSEKYKSTISTIENSSNCQNPQNYFKQTKTPTTMVDYVKFSDQLEGLMSSDLQTFPAVCIPRAAWLSHIFPSGRNK